MAVIQQEGNALTDEENTKAKELREEAEHLAQEAKLADELKHRRSG